MSKYDPLYRYLSEQKSRKVTLSLSDIESIINDGLPATAYKRPQWWGNSKTEDHHSQCKSWLDAGFMTVNVSDTLIKQCITFEK